MIGIYKIVNKINGKLYIGQTSNFKRRKLEHFRKLKRNTSDHKHLQHAYNKYGESNFEFIVLEEVSIEKLTEREQYWLDAKKSYDENYGYNTTICADSAGRGLKRSKEVKLKLCLSHKGIPSPMKGKHFSEEVRKRMSLSKMGKKLRPRSKEHCRKISETLKRKGIRPPIGSRKYSPLSEELKKKISLSCKRSAYNITRHKAL